MSSPSHNIEEYQMFIKPSKVQDVIDNKDDKSTAYIILQNNVLHSKHLDLLEQIEKLTAERDELESINDGLSRSKAHLQGIAKNQYLLSLEKSKLVSHYRASTDYLHRELMLTHLGSIPYVILCYLVTVMSFKFIFAAIVVGFTGQIRLVYDATKWKESLTKGPDIAKVFDEIQSLDKSNDHLHELIDNF
jgi:hypothetical protein